MNVLIACFVVGLLMISPIPVDSDPDIAELDIRLHLSDPANFSDYAATCLKIKPKGKNIEPFVLNDCQIYALQQLIEQYQRKGYIRANILKARQMGVSTLIEGLYYQIASNSPGTEVMIITEAEQSRDNIFEMAKRYHSECPPEFRPATKNTTKKALIFESGSTYHIMTCKGLGGKGVTKHLAHLSEISYFQASTIPTITGFLESIPSAHPGVLGTSVIKESTANGAGDGFHHEWEGCKKKWREYEAEGKQGEEPEYINIFIPWYFHQEYKKEINEYDRKKILATLTEEEKDLLLQKTLTNDVVTIEQIAWRRWKIADLVPPIGYTKEEYFKQWYPATDTEAFLFSGSRVFPIAYIRAAERECYSPKERAEVMGGKVLQNPGGRLRIWDRPRVGKNYVIGVDVAEGLKKGDYSCANVLSIPTGAQVAQWHGHIDPDLWGEVLFSLGMFYNRSVMGVEVNNHGHSTISTLKRLKYPRLYLREQIDGPEGRKVKKYGWLTTATSKMRIINQLNGVLRDGNSGIVCADTVRELDDYAILDAAEADGDRSIFGAKPNCYDDRVMSLAIALEMVLTDPKNRRARG
jgi:hypothetical protein